ncbi:hypothetical protein OUZ56_024566 [Daphnia magna]|uniref:Uncharacterized protein n=1 Tax=Daphnia magna TaxID=35525 RepID=A0ABR0B0Z0_9CRUS|nr:hypothetical protein OUZ56_024566 [Daphnia magna]
MCQDLNRRHRRSPRQMSLTLGPSRAGEIGGASLSAFPFLPADPFIVSTRQDAHLVARPLPHSLHVNLLPAKTTDIGARRPNWWPCPFKPSQSQPVKLLPARLIPHSLCPSAQSLSIKTPAVVDRLPCPCPCPPSPSQFLLVNPLAAHKKPAVVARQLPNSLWPSSSSLPVDALFVRQNARCSCPSTLSLPCPSAPS